MLRIIFVEKAHTQNSTIHRTWDQPASEISRHLDSTWPSQGLHPKNFGPAEIAMFLCVQPWWKKAAEFFGSVFGYPRKSPFLLKHIRWYLLIIGVPVCVSIDEKKSSGKFWFSIWVLKKVSVSTKTHKMLLKPAFGYWRKFQFLDITRKH